MPSGKLDTKTLAKLACAYSGITWGLFWFPLRWLSEAGIEGAWIGIIFYGIQLLVVAPFVVANLARLRNAGPGLALTTLFAGSALALYAFSVVYTEVIRAMLLFYLTPVWSTLLARWILKEPITGLRWIAIGLAFSGMLVIFGADAGVPWPRNFGDWLGLGSGILWAAAAVRLNQDRTSHPMDITFGFFAWGVIVSAVAFLLPFPAPDIPRLGTLGPILLWLSPLLAIVAVPGAYAAMWGARLIDPGIVGILFMTELIVGTITVAIWAGEPFGIREISGILLICAAGLIESVWELLAKRKQTGAFM